MKNDNMSVQQQLTLCILETPMGTLANSKDPDEMQCDAAFHLGLHCMLRLKQPSRTEKHHSLENFICDPLKYKIGNPILIVSKCMGKSISIQRVNKGYDTI